jgi:hypothetical protein
MFLVIMSKKTALVNKEEGVDDVKSAWLLRLGLHTWYNGMYKEQQSGNTQLILKAYLSPDWGLKLDLMKLELLVIVNQICHGEYVPGSCTHRPSRHGR